MRFANLLIVPIGLCPSVDFERFFFSGHAIGTRVRVVRVAPMDLGHLLGSDVRGAAVVEGVLLAVVID
jgi:hypothetical protein